MHGVLPIESGGGRASPVPEGLLAMNAARTADHSAMIAAIAARGDPEAFAALFVHFAPRVKSYCLRLGASGDLAEELAQETLLAVWRRAASYDPAKAAASTWIFTIARNLRIDGVRRERNPESFDDPALAPEGPVLPDASALAAERESRIAEAVRTLPPEQAEVIRLAFFSDKPQSEIAAALGLPLGTVKSRVRLAMARLRALLDDFQ